MEGRALHLGFSDQVCWASLSHAQQESITP